jgi:FPC/CPF motif-containing protein YcgG
VRSGTNCVFADRAKVWGAPAYTVGTGLDVFLQSIIDPLSEFLREAEAERLDGFVIELPSEYGDTVDTLATTVRIALSFLAEHDPAGPHPLSRERVNAPEWQFSFRGAPCFVIAIAPCYHVESSRYGFGSPSTFLFIQPQSSFTQLHVPRGEHRKVREFIRNAFATNGRPYDVRIAESPCEADKFVKPLTLGEPPVRWWDEPT